MCEYTGFVCKEACLLTILIATNSKNPTSGTVNASPATCTRDHTGDPSRQNGGKGDRPADIAKTDERARTQLLRMGTDPVLPLLFKISVPSIIAMISTTIYSNADVSFIGQYEGNFGLAAAGIYTPFQSLAFLSISLALAIGASASIAPALGRRDYDAANNAFFHFMLIGVIYSLIMPPIFLPWLRTLVRLLGASNATVEEFAVQYGYIMGGLGPLSFFLGVGMLPVTRNENRPVVAMILQLTAAVLNIFIDAILFPLAGWYLRIRAAAIATVVSNLVVGIVAILNFAGVLRQGILRFSLKKAKDISIKLMMKIILIGLPQFVVMLSYTLCPILGNNIVKNLDLSPWIPGLEGFEYEIIRNYYQGAYGIAVRVAMICSMPANGIFQGFLSVLGYNIGAKYYKRVHRLIKVALVSMLLISFILWGIMEGIADYFVLIYVSKTEKRMQSLAGKLLRLVIAGYGLIGCIFIASGVALMEHRPWIALILQLGRALITIMFQYLFPYVIHKGNLESSFYAFMIGDISMSVISMFVIWYYLVKYKRLAAQQDAPADGNGTALSTILADESSSFKAVTYINTLSANIAQCPSANLGTQTASEMQTSPIAGAEGGMFLPAHE